MSENEVAIPLKAQERMRALVAKAMQEKQIADTYIRGIVDSLGLEGEWDLAVERMVLIQRQRRQEPAPKDK